MDSGAKVFIWDIDEKLLKSNMQEIDNLNLKYNLVDVSKYSEVKKATLEILSNNNIDILINNAGITGPTGTLWEYDNEMWNKIVQVNLLEHLIVVL